MPILKPEFPTVGHDILVNILSELGETEDPDALGGALVQEISDPLPVHSLGLMEVAGGAVPQQNDQPVSWRYMLFKPDGVSSADLNSVGNASQVGSFNRTTKGKIVDRLYEALLFVDEKFTDAEETYEIRIIEIPSINQAAVWLFSDENSLFIPYLDAERLKGAPPSVKEGFLQDAAEQAQHRLGDSLN
ncbi:MAG: hypothetical protein ABJP02_16685 [Parasphingorhabdus sp.]|uniref:hypothetical protein n=1 Tax=Parasphingorhabdus sp. TaxID=2709688 RepID=UPI003299B628